MRGIAGQLSKYEPPKTEWPAAGAARGHWTIYQTHRKQAKPFGSLRIIRTEEGGDRTYEILEVNKARDLGNSRSKATIKTSTDTLSSLGSWSLDWTHVPYAHQPLGAGLHLEGKVEGGEARWAPGGPASQTLTGGMPLCSEWALFDTVSRLPADGTRVTLHMLEGLELYRPDQIIESVGPHELKTAQGPLTVHGFMRTGRGTLPVWYWRDEQGRVILVLSSGGAWLMSDEHE